MLVNIILWLVNKYLTKRQIFSYIADRWLSNSPYGTVEYLYDAGPDISPDFRDRIAAHRLVENNHFISASLKLVLEYLRDRVNSCGDSDCEEADTLEFFRKVNIAKNHKSHLKVRKDLFDLVQRETTVTDMLAVEMIAAILENVVIDPTKAVEYLYES